MFGSAILEVIIGLSFSFLLFALIVTELNQLLASKRLRRTCFEKALTKVFGTDPGADKLINEMLAISHDESMAERYLSDVEDEDFADFMLSKIDLVNKPAATRNQSTGNNQFQRVPPFSTLHEKVAAASDDAQALALVKQFIKRYDRFESDQAPDSVDSVLLEESFRTLNGFDENLTKSVMEVEVGAISDRCETTLLEKFVLQGIQTNCGESVTVPKRVQAIANEAGNEFGGSLDAFATEIKSYYNAVMAVATEEFKSRLWIWTASISLVIVLLLNIDTLEIGQDLYSDSIYRSTVVEAAKETGKANDLLQANPAQQLKQPGLNIGWHRFCWNEERSIWFWIFKLAGLGISFLAITLGAPFWFDTLKKLVNVRSTIPDGEAASDHSSRKSKPPVVVQYPGPGMSCQRDSKPAASKKKARR